LPSKWKGLAIAVGFLVLVELLVRTLPIEMLEQPEIFFVNLKRQFVESGQGQEDIIILGDSRSMALPGFMAKSPEEFSVYNHSLPAMGPKYYKSFLKKYLRSGNKKPKLVLYAASPLLYAYGYGKPLYDATGIAVTKNESIKEYLTRRFEEGIDRNIFATGKGKVIRYGGQQGQADQLLWEFFGHRFLHQFSVRELWEMYDGVERIFIIAKALPLLYKSYAFHGALRNALSLENWSLDPKRKEKLLLCESCEAIEAGLCKPSTSQLEDNWIIREKIKKDLGKYNISNRIKPEIVALSKIQIAQEFSENGIRERSRTEFPPLDFSPLQDLISYTESEGIPLGFVYMPWIAEGVAWEITQREKKALQALLK